MTTSLHDVERTVDATPGSAARRVAVRMRGMSRGAIRDVRDELRQLRRAASDTVSTGRRHAGRAVGEASRAIGGQSPWWEPARGPRTLASAFHLLLRPAPLPPRVQRRMVGWRAAFLTGVCMFGAWLVLDAPTLMHSAAGSPLGVRRTVAMDVLRPIAALSRDVGAAPVMHDVDDALGRTGGSVVQVVGQPVHRLHRPPLLTAAPRDTGPAPAGDGLPPLPAPTAADPLRVLSIGDSLGVDFGGPFVDDLAGTGVVNAVLDAKVDTGLSRPDYFDWPAELNADLARYQPQAVVVFRGANDPQNFVVGGQALAYGTSAWRQAYAQRVGAFMEAATSAGARVLWVGMPPMADPTLNAKMADLDEIFATQASAHPGVSYLSSWALFSDPHGGYAQYLPDASGVEADVREPDGTHMSPAGAQRLSAAVIEAMDHEWGIALQP